MLAAVACDCDWLIVDCDRLIVDSDWLIVDSDWLIVDCDRLIVDCDWLIVDKKIRSATNPTLCVRSPCYSLIPMGAWLTPNALNGGRMEHHVHMYTTV